MLSISRILTIAVVVALAAGTAGAGINTDKPFGPLNLYISPDGTATMMNDSGAPFTFDGYSIASAEGNLVPANWYTIGEHAAEPGFPERTGQPPIVFPTDLRAASWATMSDTAYLISEVHLEITATLQPGDGIGLGAVYPVGNAWTDLTFTYVRSATEESYRGYPPEPASLSLLGLGALALLRRRR